MAAAILAHGPVTLNATTARHHGNLIRMSEVIRRFGLGRQTVLRLTHEGAIRAYRGHHAGWWLYDANSIAEYLGIDDLEKEKGSEVVGHKKVCIYARRSDAGSDGAKSLESQVQLLTDYVRKELGKKDGETVVLKEQASGVTLSFKTRKALLRLWEGVERGEFHTIVVKDSSRLARIPGGLDLLKYHFEKHGVRLILAFEEQLTVDETEFKSDVNLILDFLTVVVNAKSARKAAMMTRISVPQEHIDQMLYWWNNSVSLREIEKRCKRQGIVGLKHGGKQVVLGRQKLFRLLQSHNRKKAMIANATDSQQKNSVQAFCERHLRKETRKKYHCPKVHSLDLWNAYKAFCHEHDYPQPSSRKMGIQRIREHMGLEVVHLKMGQGSALKPVTLLP